jgi:hypothetical protein
VSDEAEKPSIVMMHTGLLGWTAMENSTNIVHEYARIKNEYGGDNRGLRKTGYLIR